MSIIANDILADVSYVLTEPLVSTTLGTTIVAGTRTVTPASMKAIYVGAQLIIGTGNTQEIVTVTAVTGTTFTAIFANAHANTETVSGSTFPSGQTTHPLFTQTEMLNYLLDAQDEFLSRTRPLYTKATQNISPSTRVYTQPSDCIRIERIGISNTEILDVTQGDLDMEDPTWVSSTADVPTRWYQDNLGNAKFGFRESPNIGSVAGLWYSNKSSGVMTLTTPLIIPDPCCFYMKYAVLACCFEKDGEMRDPDRAKYCEKRVDLGVLLLQQFMQGAGVMALHQKGSLPRFTGMYMPEAM